MTKQRFPSVEEILTIVMMELPEYVYAQDRANDPDLSKRSYTSTEARAHAQVFADLYANLREIDSDKHISTVSQSGLTKWEKELFSAPQDSSLSYAERQERLLAKWRSKGSIALPAIRSLVAGILTPLGLEFDLLPYSGQNNGEIPGAWVLDYSMLEIGTYLANRDPLWWKIRTLTAQEEADVRETAYTYEVRIYGAVDSETLATLNKRLTALEPARSTHVITTGCEKPA